MGIELSTIRNIGVAAHIDAGKTTTTERILYYTGKTHRMGTVDEGTTTTDFDPEEQNRGITIYSAAVSCPWKGCTINLIDTPGHVDFTAEVERSLRVLDGMVAVFDAKEGVEAQSETVWRQADRYRVPRICFVNKMDRLGADFERSLGSIRERLTIHPVAIQVPIGAADTFEGLIDLIDMKAIHYRRAALGSTFDVDDIPERLLDAAQAARRAMLEIVCERDDELMERYLADEPIDARSIRRVLRRGTLARELTPVLCGSALRYVGVQRMLDAICDFLPSPLEVPPVVADDANRPGVKHEIPCDPNGPLAALVFKIVSDKPVDLYYLRLYSGALRPNMRLFNTGGGGKENISRVFRMFAKRRDQLDVALAGDIVAVVGPKAALTGHTLCDARKPVRLEPIHFPDTVISISVEPRSSRDREKLLEALTVLSRQDPTITITVNEETGQTLISGMGELHLEVVTHRLKRDMDVDVVVGKPRVSYRETVRRRGRGVGRFERQVGGRSHFAVVELELEPRPRTEDDLNLEIVSRVPDGLLQPEFVRAAETGVKEASQSGELGGYPVIDWKASIVGGQQRDQESSELAFENAGRSAFYQAMRSADPVLLEPIMEVEVVTCEDYFGAIVGDLKTRSAVVTETFIRGDDRVIAASVPLAQMFGYVTKLRSLSQGRATSSMTPSHYAPVSAAEMKALVG